MTGKEYYNLPVDGGYVVYTGEDAGRIHKGDMFKVEYLSEDKVFLYLRDKDGKVFTVDTTGVLQSYQKYDPDKLGFPDDWQIKQEQQPQLKKGEVIVTEKYIETLFMITADMAAKVSAETSLGRADIQDMFEAWTKEFEERYRDCDWENYSMDYWEALEKFEDDKYFAYRAKDFVWTESAAINLQYIQNANACPENEFAVNPQSDRNRRLAMEFTMYEADNHIDYDDPEQDCWESTISEWLKNHH